MKRKPFLMLPLLAMLYASANAQSPQVSEDVRQIVETTLPSQKAADTLLTPFINRIRPRYTNIDNAKWALITAELRDFVLSEFSAPNGFFDMMTHSYRRRLTETEAHEIAIFFRSDAGRKFIQQRDEVLVELFPALNNEARRLSPKVEEQFNVLVKKHGM
ncbi:MAG: DUF2059 domain-containing protein [Fimbriimonadaceae bacterium]|nr:DUF2059 domain-containing protein [Fimbriimonadaceae bacterium]